MFTAPAARIIQDLKQDYAYILYICIYIFFFASFLVFLLHNAAAVGQLSDVDPSMRLFIDRSHVTFVSRGQSVYLA